MKKEDTKPAKGLHRSHLFVVSAPSGAGKTTLCSALRERFPDMRYSVSYTTRKPRVHEQDGVDYHFISKPEFERRIALGEWAEWARVHDHFYGTSAEALRGFLENGSDVLLDIDVQGAELIRRSFPECITVFILPPSMEVLKQRLESRGTEDGQEMQKRLLEARREMACKNRYHHRIVNDDLPTAVAELVQLVHFYSAS